MSIKLIVAYHPDFYSRGCPPLKEMVKRSFIRLRDERYLDRPGVGRSSSRNRCR